MCFVACGGSQSADNTTTTVEFDDTDATPTREVSEARVARMSSLYTALGEGVDAAGSDCNAVAASIRDWSTNHGDEVKKLSSELAATPKDQVKELAPTLDAAMRRAVLQVQDGSNRCPGDESVFDAISGLPR